MAKGRGVKMPPFLYYCYYSFCSLLFCFSPGDYLNYIAKTSFFWLVCDAGHENALLFDWYRGVLSWSACLRCSGGNLAARRVRYSGSVESKAARTPSRWYTHIKLDILLIWSQLQPWSPAWPDFLLIRLKRECTLSHSSGQHLQGS